ncbi:Tn3 family transposase [Streptomyces coelicoflavus]|uniref:Tn3 family transposase n=1 Tax=Streptomyces coelicoflavus TaxID=285562 RepID=UPI002E26AAB8|nr:Tn3 family transposase [Streptomyces coelicoflavus]
MFALAHPPGFDRMPRIGSWTDSVFHRPSKQTEYEHIDALFGEPGRNVIDWDLIEFRFRHLMRVAVSVREGAISYSTLLKRLRTESKKNATYASRISLSAVSAERLIARRLWAPQPLRMANQP